MLKLSLYSMNEAQLYRDEWGYGGTDPAILISAIDGNKLSALRPGRLAPGKSSWHSLYQKQSEPGSDRTLRRRDKYLASTSNGTSAVNSAVCCHTDWTIPAPIFVSDANLGVWFVASQPEMKPVGCVWIGTVPGWMKGFSAAGQGMPSVCRPCYIQSPIYKPNVCTHQ
jgi:hypothetical protein